jgi:hypothetical protein
MNAGGRIALAAFLVFSSVRSSMNQQSVPALPSESDRRIDSLANPANITSITDVKKYIDALLQANREDLQVRFGIVSEGSHEFAEIKSRVALAEYQALSNREKRVPEKLVVEVFNNLMERWSMPSWTQITVAQLHLYRTHWAMTRNPESVTRASDGSVDTMCRPVEALLLLNFLERDHGFKSGGLKSRQLAAPEAEADPTASKFLLGSSAYSTNKGSEAARLAAIEREHEFREARRAYFASNLEEGHEFVGRVLDSLKID